MPRKQKSWSDEEWQLRKDKWKAAFLSVPASMLKLTSDEMWVHAYNSRVAVQQDHESLTRSALQQAMELVQMKALVEASNPSNGKMTAAQLSGALRNAGLAKVQKGGKAREDDDDGLSANFCTSALHVHNRLLSNPTIVEAILDLEANFGSRSFAHQMAKLAVIAQKASLRQWVMEALHDAVTHGGMKNDQITKSTLSGDKTHVGLVALMEMKHKVQVHFVNVISCPEPWPQPFKKP